MQCTVGGVGSDKIKGVNVDLKGRISQIRELLIPHLIQSRADLDNVCAK
jgi:hypothetical protein